MKPSNHMTGFGTTAWTCLAFFYLPILVVVVLSFNASKMTTIWGGFSLAWYKTAFANEALRDATINSFIVGITSTIFATMIALMTALALRGNKLSPLTQKSSYTLLTLPLLIPEIVIAIASMIFLNRIGLQLGLGNVILVHVIFCIPFAYSPISARLDTLPASLGEAAADLYATPWKAFYHVTMPLMMPGIYSGAMLAFITSLDDFLITHMVAPTGAKTLPVYIYDMVRLGITPEINVISTILLLVSTVLVLFSYLINNKEAK